MTEEETMHWQLMDWWPTVWMAGVYVAAWILLILIAAKALTDARRHGPR